MDFEVVVGRTPPALSESPPSTPALEAATAEYEKVMTDPTHEHYEGLRRGDKAANDYVDGLYRRAVPNNKPIEIGKQESVSGTTGGPEDAEFALSPEDVAGLEALKQDWGDQFQAHHADAIRGMERITRVFGGEADDLTAAVLAAGGDLKLVMNIARHFGNAARGYAP